MTIRTLHKWLSIIIGIQVLIWVLSGSIISLLDQDTVQGRSTYNAMPPVSAIGASPVLFDITELALPANTELQSVRLARVGNKLNYLLDSSVGTLVFNAYTGEAFGVSEAQAQQTALKSYKGTGNWVSNEYFAKGSEELVAKHGHTPQWRIEFDDSINTRVFVSGIGGRVLAHRNCYSQIVDFLLMLHFMDYADEHSFNNLQVRVVAFAALWLAISGLLLVQSSFSRRDFGLKTRTKH